MRCLPMEDQSCKRITGHYGPKKPAQFCVTIRQRSATPNDLAKAEKTKSLRNFRRLSWFTNYPKRLDHSVQQRRSAQHRKRLRQETTRHAIVAAAEWEWNRREAAATAATATATSTASYESSACHSRRPKARAIKAEAQH